MVEQRNVVRDYGTSNGHCAYCQDPSRFVARGMMTSALTVQTCQDLIDIGWTRAGQYLYMPDLRKMCCPSYTIRLKVQDFAPSRDHKKAMRKLQSYLNGGPLSAKYAVPQTPDSPPSATVPERYSVLWRLLRDLVQKWAEKECIPKVDVDVVLASPTAKQRKYLSPRVFLTSPICLSLFHAMSRLQGEAAKWRSPSELATNFCSFFQKEKETIYQQRLAPVRQMDWERLVQDIAVHASKGHINFSLLCSTDWNAELSLRLQSAIQENEPSPPCADSPENRSVRLGCQHPPLGVPLSFCTALNRRRRFTTHWAPTSFVEEEFHLYQKYQTRIHKEPLQLCTASRYSRFLVDSPLISDTSDGDLPPPGMGSFHLQYRIDGRLVAVGVIDILPRSLCSAYLFWDPDFAPLSLGKISALTEIDWVRAAQKTCPSLQYYSIGYYVHSCAKTQYKGDYTPSELLCPETCLWVKLTEDIKKRLWEQAYLVLSALPGAECQENIVLHDAENEGTAEIEDQRVLVLNECMTLAQCMRHLAEDDGRWNESQRKTLELVLPFARLAMEEWRRKTLRVADQLIYSFSEFLADG